MSLYLQSSAALPITHIAPGDKQTVFSADSPTTGQASQAVGLTPERFGVAPKGIRAEIKFSGAPGTFDFRIQTSDTDQDAFYNDLPGAAVTTVNTGNVVAIEAQTTARFARIVAHTQTQNAVTVTATLSRA